MNYLDLVRNRHSVRKFKDLEIEVDKKNKIKEKVKSLNEKSGLNFQVFLMNLSVLNQKFLLTDLLKMQIII